MEIGVLALQGAVREHLSALERCRVTGRPIKKLTDLAHLDGLIIPGGESTAIGKHLVRYDLLVPIREKALAGMAIFGTCTGLILLAREIDGYDQPRLGLMHITVGRNAFGRQIDSFETDLPIPAIGPAPFRAIFIRAPIVTQANAEVEILARYEQRIVLVRQGRLLAASFHPELTTDPRLHQYFLDRCVKSS